MISKDIMHVNTAMYLRKRALYIFAKEPYKSAKERYISEIRAFCEICA